jgi:MinD-like ATPase involved in chromosome partitioning or flagellar assembly
VVRAAYTWNLAVELARLGAASTLIAPADADSCLLWPEPGTGPVGCEMVLADATGLADLNRCALDVAVSRAAESSRSGVVFVQVPPQWLRDAREARGLLRWVLLYGTPERRDQLETYGLAKQLLEAHPDARIGVTIHGVRRVAEAEQAFRRVAEVAERRLGQALSSYGLLVDDLHIYRAIVARRPIGLEHPQSRAARALQDVARMLLEDIG